MKRFKVFGVAAVAAIATILAFWWHWSMPLFILSLFFYYYLTTYWIFDRDINFVGLFTVLLFPALFLSSLSLALLVYASGVLAYIPHSLQQVCIDLGFFLIITICAYALILAMNIYNVSRYKRLPLLQAAQTVTYISSYAGGYVLLTLVHHFATYQWYITLPLFILISGFLFFINNWSIKLDIRTNVFYTLLGMFIITQIGMLLLLFPSLSFIFPLVITLTIYIFNGVLMHLTRRNPLRRFIFEYILLAAIILALLLFNSHWGVAGNIIGL